MSASHDLERRLAAHFAAEAPSRAPDWVLADALETIDITPQRRVLVHVPWRFPAMNMSARLAAMAVAVVALGALGFAVLSTGGTPVSPMPTSTPASTPAPTPETLRPPALTGSYTSVMHGISIGHPAGWSISPATRPWAGAAPYFGEAPGDFLYDPSLTDHLFLLTASQSLGDTSAEAWLAETAAASECPSTEAITIDGVTGSIGTDCNRVLVAANGRGYLILLYTSGDDVWLDEVYDRAWFLRVLDTVRFGPSSSTFSQPFSHSLPPGVVFDLGPDYGPAYFEARVPTFADAGMPSGLIIQAIGGGRADPCAETSAPASLAAGPQAVVDYLRGIPELSVAGVTPTTVSGLPAVEATVTVEPTAACPAIWPWTESPEPMPDGSPLRLMAVDVGGEHVVLIVYGEARNPAWDAMADELIGSIRFEST